MKKIFETLSVATILNILGVTKVFAVENKEKVCGALGGCEDSSFSTVWVNIIELAAFVVGAVAVLMLVIGGLRYVLSAGDAQATQSAKNTILYALIGVVVAFIAWTVVNFVLNQVTGV